MRFAVLINSAAGSAGDDPSEQADTIRAAFAKAGAEAEVRAVHPDALTEQARRLAADSEIRAIVAAGGDGTVNAVAAALAGTGTALGVLPLGTLNHFAKALGMPQRLDEAAAALVAAEVTAVDVAEVNGRVFVNNSALGVYPSMVAIRDELRNSHGWGKIRATAVAAVRALRSLPVHRLDLAGSDGFAQQRVRTPMVFVGNGVYDNPGGGVLERIDLTDGLLGVAVARAGSRLRLFALALRTLAFGASDGRDLQLVELISLDVSAHTSRLRVAVDGEVGWLATPLRYRTRSAGLNVLRPT